MPKPKDYLQVFKLTLEDEKQKIIHIQEEPEYQREYLLSADCFEIVTHPMTLEYHANEMPWLKLMERAIDLGYRSHS